MDEALTAPAPAGRWIPIRLLKDERLVVLAAEGDQNAFAEIYRRYHQELYRFCRAIVGCVDEAQDALQSTMVSVLRSLPGESRTIALRPWLYRIAHNEAVTLVRQRSASSLTSDGEVPELEDPLAGRKAQDRERLRQLLRDLESLPERQRGALTMRELSGMSYTEIGSSLGLSDAAARQAVYEARVSLQHLSEGREMDCKAVRQALSVEDRRILRGRRLRAHLRTCDGCRGFQTAIDGRRADFQGLFPPLPAAAAAGLLQAAFGGAGALGGAASGATASGVSGVAGLLGGLAGKGAASSPALKSIVAALVAGAVGAGAGSVADVPKIGQSESQKSVPAGGAAVSPSGPLTLDGVDSLPGTLTAPGNSDSSASSHGDGGSAADRQGSGAASAASGHIPSEDNAPSPHVGGPVQGGGASSAAPGHGATPPGHGGTPPGQSDPGSSGNSGAAPGHGASPPGLGGTPPGQAQGAGPGPSSAPPGSSGASASGPSQNSAATSGPPGQSEAGPPGQSSSGPPGQAKP